MEFIVCGIEVRCFIFTLFGRYVAIEKRRGEGVLLGLLFGPLGVVVEALLPTGEAPAAPTPTAPRALT